MLGLSAQQTTRVISVNDPRPLSEAIIKLENASNLPIAYEDPPFAYTGDLVDGSNIMRHPPGVKVLLPKGGPLTVAFTNSEVANRASTAKVLQRLVTTFNRSCPWLSWQMLTGAPDRRWLSWQTLTGAPDPRDGDLRYYYLNIQQHANMR